jgi:hypothetical protein
MPQLVLTELQDLLVRQDKEYMEERQPITNPVNPADPVILPIKS